MKATNETNLQGGVREVQWNGKKYVEGESKVKEKKRNKPGYGMLLEADRMEEVDDEIERYKIRILVW